MTIRVEMTEPSAIRRELRIEVEAAKVAAELDHVLGEVSRGARLPGFRPGRVPRSLLRKRYAREIENEVLEHLVPGAVRQALEETGLEPVHQPVIRDVTLEEGHPLVFTASFEVRPRVEPRDYKGLGLRLPEARVEEADVERELEAMRDAAAEYAAVEPRPLERGDFALVDLSVRGDEETPSSQSNVLIEVGGEEYHPRFAQELEGMRPGEEKLFTIEYEPDDPDPQARGRSLTYGVSLKEIKKKVLAPLDDEFARDAGKGSLAELRAQVRDGLERRLERQVRRAQEQQLVDALAPQVEGDVPQSLVERELDRMLDEQARGLLARGIDPRTAPIDWRATREKLAEHAVRKVRWELVLEAIARREGIEPTAGDLEGRLGEIAAATQKSVEFVRSKIEKDRRMEEVTRGLRLEQTVDFLIRNARMERR